MSAWFNWFGACGNWFQFNESELDFLRRNAGIQSESETFFLQLLGEDRFQDIEKIKTIGSTYMAVSGLSPEKQVRPCRLVRIAVRTENPGLFPEPEPSSEGSGSSWPPSTPSPAPWPHS